MSKSFSILFCVCVFLLGPNIVLYAQVSDDALARLLRQKGILNDKELFALERQAVIEQPSGLSEEQVEEAVNNALPSWVRKMKWSGDMRVRYEHIERTDNLGVEATDRNRYRIRFRYGFKAKANEQIEVGARLATGSSGSATSTNSTLSGGFNSDNIILDRAYIKYDPIDWLTLYLGKFANPFLHTDLVFDSDLSFEGFTEIINLYNDYADVQLILGQFPLDESSGDNNVPWLYAAQVRTQFSPFEDSEMDLGLARYAFSNLFNHDLRETITGSAGGSHSNIVDPVSNGYLNNFDLYNITGKLKFALEDVPVTLIGDYVVNRGVQTTATEDEDSGYQLGIKLGKAKEPKTMEGFLYYKRLEREAVVDVLTDSDFGGGQTNHEGYKMGLKYQLGKNAKMGLTYFNTESTDQIIPGDDDEVSTLQLDMAVKF